MKGATTVTVVRKPRKDRLKPEASAEERFDLPGCIVFPRASNEEGAGWIQISGENLFIPAGSSPRWKDVVAEDEIILREARYSVTGEPGYFEKSGKAKGILVTLEKVT